MKFLSLLLLFTDEILYYETNHELMQNHSFSNAFSTLLDINSLAANCIFWDNHSNGDTSIKFGMHNLLRSSIQKKTLAIPKSKMAAIFQDGCQ